MEIIELRNALDVGLPIEYSAHCQKRMLERGISRDDIKHCIYNGEIIEVNVLADDNKSNKSLPSCLILDYRVVDNRAIHVLVGFNGRRMLIISVCYPDSEHWFSDNKTRRK
jgi:hypothetical protein